MVSVVGPFFWSPLGSVIILASLLPGVWFFLVGYGLIGLGRAAPFPGG